MLKAGFVLDGKYRIIRLLGQGGWGRVYLAENVNVGNKWAVKEITAAREPGVNLLAEPEMLKKLNHRSLPRIVDIVRESDTLYLIEDYFEGIGLKEIIRDRAWCTEENAVNWARQLCDILIYLHGIRPNPIIYRDMKPGNIIITRENQVRLVDFGIAREYKRGGSSDTTFIGTRGYAAPEQFLVDGQSDERTDIYGLGATLYHVLTGVNPGQPPYKMVPVRTINKSLSPAIERLVSRSVENEPEKRYQSAAELLGDLNSLESEEKRKKDLKTLIRAFTGRFLKRKFTGNEIKDRLMGTAIISVAGTARGIGCTYTAIATAVFLARQGYKTALLEMNENPVFFSMEEDHPDKGSLDGSFRCNGVDFYWQNNAENSNTLIQILRAGYHYLILDLGLLTKIGADGSFNRLQGYEEMARADLPVLVAGSAVWQLKDLVPYLREKAAQFWFFAFRTPDMFWFNQIKEEVPGKALAIPFAPDPFKLDVKAENFYQQILINLPKP